ncbi:MAG: hypothetical protein BAA04_07060 [Firmicutes bacterium ZCTH02-B6]|nr:MAG: hypothetical protein BAA04_07060 [Firmicutes bacterium ZCTH02-B6]
MIDLQELKARIDYESYYSAHGLQLRGSGPERTALCPFHDDRHDSLGVNVVNGLWICYACGAQGDVIEYHRRRYGLEWKEAVEDLARMVGSAGGRQLKNGHPPKSNEPPKNEPPPIPEEEVLRYHQALLAYPTAMAFLLNKKGLTEETIRRYQLGIDDDKRITIPIRDETGAVRNLRRYHPTRTPKMLPYKEGYGEARLFPIAALESEQLVLCEGEWDCLLARQIGLPAICHTGGANTWKDHWTPLFKGKFVTIVYDNDQAGRDGAARVARALAPVAAEVRVVTLPVEQEHEDFSDWVLKYGGTIEQWRELVGKAEIIEPPPAERSRTDLPKIDAGSGDLAGLADQAWAAIKASNSPPHLFQRGGLLTRIQLGDAGEPKLTVVTEAGLRGILARVAWWYRTVGQGENARLVDAMPPVAVVKDMMAAPEYPVPIIARIVEAPVFGRDGELNLKPGYHTHSRTYYWSSGIDIPDVGRPDPDQIDRAKRLLLYELLCDFPFISDAELAHAVAALLGPFVREMINGPTPLHLIEAPSPGTGKSLLADVIAIPATGRPAATMTEGRDEDEWRKRITSVLIAAPTYVLIDNIRRKLDSASLAAALTSQMWQDRILGRSELTTLPVRAIWLATGNNPALTTEMARRTVRIRLDAKVARPWQRQGFKHEDLRSWAYANRGELVWAALTLVQAWVEDGMKPGRYVLGQYEAWARVIGGILDTAGIRGFLGNLEELYSAADEETAQWEAFCEAWWTKFGASPRGLGDLFTLAEEQDLLLTVRGDGNERSQKIRMGKALAQMRDRQVGQFRLVQAGQDGRNRSAIYKLVRLEWAARPAEVADKAEVFQTSTTSMHAQQVVDDDDSPF